MVETKIETSSNIFNFTIEQIFRSLGQFRKKKTIENAKWAFVELYEKKREIPPDVMEMVYQFLKKQVDDYHEKHPPEHWSKGSVWVDLYFEIEEGYAYINGEEVEIKDTQEKIFTRYAKYMGIEDTEDTSAWMILMDRYKRRFRGKK